MVGARLGCELRRYVAVRKPWGWRFRPRGAAALKCWACRGHCVRYASYCRTCVGRQGTRLSGGLQTGKSHRFCRSSTLNTGCRGIRCRSAAGLGWWRGLRAATGCSRHGVHTGRASGRRESCGIAGGLSHRSGLRAAAAVRCAGGRETLGCLRRVQAWRFPLARRCVERCVLLTVQAAPAATAR